MMKKAAALLAASGLALAASPADAQTRIDGPWSVDGALAAGDARTAEGQLYDDHRLILRQGQRLRIAARADQADTMLMLFGQGAPDEMLAGDDDSGGALNPRLTFTVPADGEYVVRVIGYSSNDAGAYRLSVEPQAPPPPPVTAHSDTVTTTGTWRIFEGELTAGDPDLEGRRFDDYRVDVAPGGHVLVQLDSQAFDPVLLVYPLEGGEDYPIVSDDDGGPGLNSLLLFDPPEGGSYILRVTSYGEGEAGRYRLSVTP